MGALDLQFDADSKYTRIEGRVLLTGIEALVRLPMAQRRLDRARGLNTAGLISGYRGSPLGAYDQQLWKASSRLAEHDIVFQPGLNEDLAATALWGAQMHHAYGPTRVDGVFGLWYGKGPGVDRSGDALRAGNMLGTSRLGGVLVVTGDDHAAQSSMYPHQTDGILQSVSIPILQPANVREILEYGLAGFELSRFSGLWVGLKTIAEVVETAASFDLPPPPAFRAPDDFIVPAHGLNWDPSIAWPGQRAELERRLIDERLPAARAWVRANGLDKVVVAAPRRRLGVMTVGKAHQDVMQAFSDLQLSPAELQAFGISIYKVAMSWPLETEGALAFADGHDEVVVVEEKRSTVEAQLKEALYHRPQARRPAVSGKTDPTGRPLLPEVSEFSALLVARTLASRMAALQIAPANLAARLAAMEPPGSVLAGGVIPIRRPYFCAGCPHNSSTPTPAGSISGGGIGCHVMALQQPWLKTSTFSQMGAEGAQWIGAAPFSQTTHTFQNLGDGTYQHSGLLAIRAAVAAKTNITYKILYNDAVAMTGGQPAEGVIDPARITRQLSAEGVGRIVLVSDEPGRWHGHAELAPGVSVHHRDEMDAVQRALREVPGVTALLYEQTCAAEKRRRRKRGAMAEPDRRLFINDRVCEGCGDCSVQSNCIAVEPLPTPFGRKRAINQNACNKDFSCVKGFCPSFVEVSGAELRKPDGDRLRTLEASLKSTLDTPTPPALDGVFNVYVTGIGGTGVLTMGALIAGAAHLEGKGASVLDFTGLAQKNGAVVSQVRLAGSPEEIHAARIGAGATDLVLAADSVVTAAADSLARMSDSRTTAVVNVGEAPTADVVRERDATLPIPLLKQRLTQRCRPGALHFVDASDASRRIFGDTLPTHTLLLGFAWQRGLVPLGQQAIERAIELNGAAVQLNLRAFTWGRILATNPNAFDKLRNEAPTVIEPASLEEFVEQRARDLVEYQDVAYAQRYRALVRRAQDAERRADPNSEAFAMAVARNAYRVMACKDEYEVARLYTSADFKASLAAQFSRVGGLSIWLAPPLISRPDPTTGRPRKRRFGAWVLPLLGVLATLRRVRGTPLDIFGYSAERRAERRLAADYVASIDALTTRLDADTLAAAVEIASLPLEVRGFGPVKEAAMRAWRQRHDSLVAVFGATRSPASGHALESAA